MTEPPHVLPRPGDGLALPRWEALRVGRYYGLQALSRINLPGTVAVDPAVPGVYFFVESGATAAWPAMPAGGPMSVTTELELPPRVRCTPPGAYWLVPPRRGTIRLTDAGTLRRALSEVIPAWAVMAS